MIYEKMNAVLEKARLFASTGVGLSLSLKAQNHYELASQLLRSATSVGANVEESQNCESPRDFVHKLNLAQKECAESLFWIRLCKEHGLLDFEKLDDANHLDTEILRLTKAIIKSTKANNQSSFR